MADTLLATTTDAAAIADVRAQVSAEHGYPGPELPCADGSKAPEGCPCRVLNAFEVEVIRAADPKVAPVLVHPMPVAALSAKTAAKVVAKTAEQVATLKAAAVVKEPEPVKGAAEEKIQ